MSQSSYLHHRWRCTETGHPPPSGSAHVGTRSTCCCRRTRGTGRTDAWSQARGHTRQAATNTHTHKTRVVEGRKEMFYLTTHSTHFIYGYMASDIWLRTILIVRKKTRCRHMGYSFRLTARILLYAPSHRQYNTYHSLCYTSRGALVGTRKSSMGTP